MEDQAQDLGDQEGLDDHGGEEEDHQGFDDHGYDSASVADSAIGVDPLSTMTAPDDVFSFVEENGRTYHSYKAPSKFSHDILQDCLNSTFIRTGR